MTAEIELKINARGLSSPGPRMMVETVLAKGPCRRLRVVVSDVNAVEDLQNFFRISKAKVKVDQVGEEYHVLANFETE